MFRAHLDNIAGTSVHAHPARGTFIGDHHREAGGLVHVHGVEFADLYTVPVPQAAVLAIGLTAVDQGQRSHRNGAPGIRLSLGLTSQLP